MTIAQDLAARVNTIKFEGLPKEAIYWAKTGISDSIGVSLAGCQEPTAKIPAKVLGAAQQAGPSLVWGSAVRTTALDAALINGTATHALDFDDCSSSMAGHPSTVLVPGAVALGEELNVSGRDLIEAYAAGFETQARVAKAVHWHHYNKGWHPTATLGIFGATVASGRLLKLTDDQLATALSLACSLAAGVKSNFGSMTKPLHAGLTARNGLFAALMAREGFTASPEAFEHKQGYLEVFNGAGTYDVDKIFADTDHGLDITYPAICVKQHPCCGSTHPAIDAGAVLHEKLNLTVDQIENVEAEIHEFRLAHINRPDPKGELDAKFSVQYCTARALLEGEVILEHFENKAYDDQTMRALMAKTEAKPIDGDNQYIGTVRVTLKDGSVHEETAIVPAGRGPDNPMTDEQLKAKFVNCAQRLLNTTVIEPLYDAFCNLETIKSIREMTALLETKPSAAQAAE